MFPLNTAYTAYPGVSEKPPHLTDNKLQWERKLRLTQTYSRFVEHDIACLAPPLVRDECLLLHCSRLGNFRDIRHYSMAREVTFRYSGDPAHKRHPKRTAGFYSQYTTPTGNVRQAVSLEWKKIPAVSGTPITPTQCDTATVCQAMDVLCCLQFSCMPPQKKNAVPGDNFK